MVKLDDGNIIIYVPQSWDDITLGHYETFYTDKPETAHDRVAYVAKVCKTDTDILLSRPAEVFNIIVGHIGFLFEDITAAPNPCIEIGDVKYIVPLEDELSLGAWVDADEAQKKGENVLSNTLAIVCRPVGEEYNCKNNDARAAMFAALPVSKVLGVLAFFLHCKAVSDRRTAACTKIAEAYGQLPLNIKYLLNPGAGIGLLRIWRTIKYTGLTILLRYRLRMFLRTCNSGKTSMLRMKRSTN